MISSRVLQDKKSTPALKSLLFLFFLCYSSILFGQINIDSLNQLLPTLKGAEKVDLLNKLSWEYKFSDPDRAEELIQESIDLSKKTNYIKGEALALYYLAAFRYLKGEFFTSLDITKKSTALYERTNNSLGLANNWMLNGLNQERLNNYEEAFKQYEKTLATCKLFEYHELLRKVRTNMASLSFRQGNFSQALDEYLKLSSLCLEQRDTFDYYLTLQNIARTQKNLGQYSEALSNYFEIEAFEKSQNRRLYLANNYNEIGVIYLKLGLGNQTLETFEKAAQLYQELGNRRKVAMVNENIGNYFSNNEELEKADFFYAQALHIYDSLDLNVSGGIYNNIASLRIKTKQFDEALTLLNKSLKINQGLGSKNEISRNYANMGAIYFELGQIQKSEQFYLKSIDISKEIGDAFQLQKDSEALVKIYKLTNNDKAFEFYSTINQVANDSLFSKEKIIELNKLIVTKLHEEHKNKTEELSNEIVVAKKELVLNKSFFSSYKFLIGFLFIFLAIGIIWLFNKQKQTSQLNRRLQNKITEDQKKIENKNKQLTLLALEAAQQFDLFEKIRDSLHHVIKEHPENPKIKKLENILKAHSTDQNNWENFTTYFNEIYVGFFDRLSKSYPSITTKELRLCALIRLKIPSYEASLILGISPRSVHQSRYRISKKLKLPNEINIDGFICSI